jgi:hypothetical protein
VQGSGFCPKGDLLFETKCPVHPSEEVHPSASSRKELAKLNTNVSEKKQSKLR